MKHIITICIVSLLFTASTFCLTEFEKALENAKSYYSNGEYEKAIEQLEKAKSFAAQSEQVGLIEAYK